MYCTHYYCMPAENPVYGRGGCWQPVLEAPAVAGDEGWCAVRALAWSEKARALLQQVMKGGEAFGVWFMLMQNNACLPVRPDCLHPLPLNSTTA